MTGETRVKKRARISGALITIKAGQGDKQKSFQVHEDVIKETSPFFRAALDKKWQEGQTREITLPEDSPEEVSLYIDWCYSQQLASSSCEPAEMTMASVAKEQRLLARLYFFGDKAQDDKFCDSVLTAMTELQDTRVKTESGEMMIYYGGTWFVPLIYNNTLPSSPLRRYVVDIFITYGRKRWFDNDKYMDVPEFLRDLAVAQIQNRARPAGEKVYGRRKEWFKQK